MNITVNGKARNEIYPEALRHEVTVSKTGVDGAAVKIPVSGVKENAETNKSYKQPLRMAVIFMSELCFLQLSGYAGFPDTAG